MRLRQRAVFDFFSGCCCFGCACGIPVLAFWKFTRIDMSEAEILIGVLATMSMALQFTLVGLHLETRARAA